MAPSARRSAPRIRSLRQVEQEDLGVLLPAQHEPRFVGHGRTVAGDVQVMSAGTGIFHSEYNKLPHIPLELLQIWVFPDKKNVVPRYDQKTFDPQARKNQWLKPFDLNELLLKQASQKFI